MGLASVFRTAARGAAAGAVGTVAMDLVWYVRYRSGGGDSPFLAWETTTEADSWDEAPAPAQVARKLLERATGREVSVERAAALNNVMHWAYGTSWTAAYAVAAGRLGPRRPWWHGLAFGGLVWSSDYVTLPLAGVYEPIWRYDVATLWQDLSAHLVFGVVADAAVRAVER
jgi:hypothetical protein